MISLIMEFALFMTVLFVVVPGMVAFFTVGLHPNRKSWQKDSVAN